MAKSNIKLALDIAINDLRSCYANRGIKTGSRGVYWSWDSFFASFGSIALGDLQITKKNLRLYLDNQLPDGNIPKRIAHPLYPLKYIGFPITEDETTQKPSFHSPYFTGRSISQCPVFIVAFLKYFQASNDLSFLKKNITKLEKILTLLEDNTYKNGLLHERIGGGWAESVLKRGAIAYTNMCYSESYRAMSLLEESLGNKQKEKEFSDKYLHIKQTINDKLWDDSRGGFYSDWVGLSRHHHFNADGNLLAILWDIADPLKAKKIDEQLDYLLENFDIPVPLTSDKYSFLRIFFANRWGGIKDYHVAFSWLWLGALAAVAKKKLGQKKTAINILEKISKQIIKDNNVCEIYFNNKPVNVKFYKCERPWAWSAGMFIYACEQLDYLSSIDTKDYPKTSSASG